MLGSSRLYLETSVQVVCMIIVNLSIAISRWIGEMMGRAIAT